LPGIPAERNRFGGSKVELKQSNEKMHRTNEGLDNNKLSGVVFELPMKYYN
jgi:hypothetical protein